MGMVEHSHRILKYLNESIDFSMAGLEVAPYFSPCLSKSEYRVFYTDYIDNDAIRAKAAENPDMAGFAVPEIDFVWPPGAALKECMKGVNQFGYVVASHVMEHVPNPVGWLNELASTMAVGGRIALFLPDRRYNNDYRRRETSFAQMIEWWIEQPTAPTVGQVVDFMEHSLTLLFDEPVDWHDPVAVAAIQTHYPTADIISTGVALYNNRPYIDVHCTVWTVDSFRSVFERLGASGVLGLRLVDVVSDEGEFLAVLEKVSEPSVAPPTAKLPANAPVPFEERLKSIEHQLGMLRHDLGYVIDNAVKPAMFA
jgi:SAM-dependent methyltransferase